ncbi:MAG: hypothetical protein ABW048_14635 [Sphingobium sp.]
MKINAALAFGPGQPLRIETVELSAPAAGEVLVRLVATETLAPLGCGV